jgi:hypothetical protein
MTNLDIINKKYSSKPMLCKDGTTQNSRYVFNKSTGKYIFFSACLNNGGASEQKVEKEAVKPIMVKPITDEVKKQNLNLASRVDVMTQEDKFYEIFGIKKSRSGDIGIQSRPLGRLLVAVFLVAGYFAYKKFKK